MLEAAQLAAYRAFQLSWCAAILPPRTFIEVRGSDRAQFMHNLCTNEIAKLPIGQGREALVTNVQGKTVGQVIVLAADDRLILDGYAGQADRLSTHLERYVIREDVQVRDHSEQHAAVLVCGIEALAGLQRVGLPAPATMLAHESVTWNDQPALVARVPYVDNGWLVWLPRESAQQVVDQCMAAGAFPAGQWLPECLRVETGFPAFGIDFNTDRFPQELARDGAYLSFSKGCYLGQETVARIDALGHVNWLMRAVTWSDAAALSRKFEWTREGHVIGRLTSGIYSPRWECGLGIALLRREVAQPGLTLEGEHLATVRVLGARPAPPAADAQAT